METRRSQSRPPSRQRKAPPPQVLIEELIVEILSWLPVKSLLQFRCVCKSWKTLISDPTFVKLHLQRSARNPKLLLLWEQFPDVYEESEWGLIPCSVRSLLQNPSSIGAEYGCYELDGNNGRSLVGSCNGLVCLVGHIFENTVQEYWFYLWNPATRSRSKMFSSLPIDFRAGLFKFVFGYDNLSDSYKVVAFHVDGQAVDESERIQVKICSSSDNCWRNIQSFPVVPFVLPHIPGHNDGVYFGGTVNWLALCNINSDDYKWNNTITIDELVIVSLDLGRETYTQLLPPRLDEVEAPQVQPTIGVLMDCLCFSHDYKRTHFVVWQMKEFGIENSWTQSLKLSYQDLQIDCLNYEFPLLPLCMSKNGDVLIMAKADETQAILYNRRDNRVERTEASEHIFWNDPKDYIESLVLPCCN